MWLCIKAKTEVGGKKGKKKKLLNWLYVHKTKKEEEEKEKKCLHATTVCFYTPLPLLLLGQIQYSKCFFVFFLTCVRLSLKENVRQSGSRCTFSANFGENATWRESLLISDGFLHAAPSGGKQGHIFLIKIVVSSLSADYKSVENLPHW